MRAAASKALFNPPMHAIIGDLRFSDHRSAAEFSESYRSSDNELSALNCFERSPSRDLRSAHSADYEKRTMTAPLASPRRWKTDIARIGSFDPMR
jgi:hypothetical protein